MTRDQTSLRGPGQETACGADLEALEPELGGTAPST